MRNRKWHISNIVRTVGIVSTNVLMGAFLSGILSAKNNQKIKRKESPKAQPLTIQATCK
jgi:hypothetical protein